MLGICSLHSAMITQQLSTTIDQLPELRMKQKILDMHTVLATHLLNTIVKRQLDSFISMEESINKMNIATILQVIRDSAKGPEDKLRLFLIYYLSHGNVPKEEVSQVEIALKEAGCDTSSLQYIEHVQMYSKMTVQNQQTQQAPTGDLLGSFTSNFSKLTETLQTTGIGEGFGNLISGVKNMLPTRKEFTVTQIVDAIMESTPSNNTEGYLTFDPKLTKPAPPKKQTFQDALVFVIGGGNYNEYHNLLDYVQVFLLNQAIKFGEKNSDIWINRTLICK
jgi:sec1 family domain-containing protein 1